MVWLRHQDLDRFRRLSLCESLTGRTIISDVQVCNDANMQLGGILRTLLGLDCQSSQNDNAPRGEVEQSWLFLELRSPELKVLRLVSHPLGLLAS